MQCAFCRINLTASDFHFVIQGGGGGGGKGFFFKNLGHKSNEGGGELSSQFTFKISLAAFNKPFLSCFMPPDESESWCTTFHMKGGLFTCK